MLDKEAMELLVKILVDLETAHRDIADRLEFLSDTLADCVDTDPDNPDN